MHTVVQGLPHASDQEEQDVELEMFPDLDGDLGKASFAADSEQASEIAPQAGAADVAADLGEQSLALSELGMDLGDDVDPELLQDLAIQVTWSRTTPMKGERNGGFTHVNWVPVDSQRFVSRFLRSGSTRRKLQRIIAQS